MIKIALDEAGIFETSEDIKKVKKGDDKVVTTLIGGILFDDNDIEGELDWEKARVGAFYKAAIDEVNKTISKKSDEVKYPDNLHYRNGYTKEQSWALNKYIGPVKKTVEKRLREFLLHGTYDGKTLKYLYDMDIPARQGKYNICAVVKSENGKSGLLANKEDRFFRDGVASNVYYHMASETVEHLIFHNPFYPEGNSFSLDIAKRETADIDPEYQEDYEFQSITGIEKKAKKKSEDENIEEIVKKHYTLMNADVFRTIMSEQMLVAEKKNVTIDYFSVESIKYDDKHSDRQPFFYLADTICSVLTNDNKRNDVEYVFQRATNIMGECQLIFAYDDVDEYLRRAWRDMEVREYYDALKELYSIEILKTNEARVYKKYWIDYVKQEMVKETQKAVSIQREPHALVEAITELRSSYMTNVLSVEEANYIFEALQEVAKGIPKNERYAKLHYMLNDIGLVSNCHRGNFIEAAEYFENCERYAYAIDLEEYIRTRNRYSNALLDGFAYEEALRVIRTTLELAGGMYELSKTVLGARKKNHFGKLEYAKTLSQSGQAAAYLRSTEASSFFSDALKLMKDNVANRKITESYRLHYLIDAENKEEYMLAMSEYNEGFDSIKNQIEAMKISSMKEDINISFALFIYLKGLNKFYSKSELQEVWDDIVDLVDSVEEERKKSHPWQLIYKYMALLSIKFGKIELANDYCTKITKVSGTKPDSIVSAIGLYGKAQVLEALGEEEEANKIFEKVFKNLNLHFVLFNPDKIKCKTVDDKKKYLDKKFSYMYS